MKKLLPYRRALLALCFGLGVFGYLMELRRSSISSDRIQYERGMTRRQIQDLEEEVRAYRRQHGALPRSLGQLGDFSHTVTGQDGHGRVFDAWSSPYIYEINGEDFRIISYGRDGLPGGVGLDCDLASDNLYPRAALIPYSKFLTYPSGGQTLIATFCAGLFVAAMTWFTFDKFSYWFVRLTCLLVVIFFVLIFMMIALTATSFG